MSTTMTTEAPTTKNYRIFENEDDAVAYLETMEPNAEDVKRFQEEASQRDRQAQESWERSDTDGCLTQACAGIMAGKFRAEKELAEHGGCGVFRCLLSSQGELASSKLFIFPNRFAGYGTVVKWCVPVNGQATWITDGPRATKKAGLKYGYIVAPGFVAARSPFNKTEEPRGTGGISSVHYRPFLDHQKAGLTI